MLLCSPHLSRILSAFERMLGSAVNETLSLEMFPELIGSERDPGLQLEMRRQTSSRPDAEEIPVGMRAAFHRLPEKTQVPRSDLRRTPRSGLVLQARHPFSDPTPLPVGDGVLADSQDLGNAHDTLTFCQHQQSGCSGPGSSGLGGCQDPTKAPSLRSSDTDQYRCWHEVRPPSSSPEGSLLHTQSQECGSSGNTYRLILRRVRKSQSGHESDAAVYNPIC